MFYYWSFSHECATRELAKGGSLTLKPRSSGHHPWRRNSIQAIRLHLMASVPVGCSSDHRSCISHLSQQHESQRLSDQNSVPSLITLHGMGIHFVTELSLFYILSRRHLDYFLNPVTHFRSFSIPHSFLQHVFQIGFVIWDDPPGVGEGSIYGMADSDRWYHDLIQDRE